MKKLFLSLVALMVAAVSFAQNTLVATLSHGDSITMYYGIYALRDAHNAAVSGDVINLSGGGFQSTDITKAVTVRGTGYNDKVPTVISNDFTINVPTADTCRLSMEGIRVTGKVTFKGTFSNPYFLKCYFPKEISFASDSNIKNVFFANCDISGDYFDLGGSSTVQFVNCYVLGFMCSSSNSGAFFLNCMINPRHGLQAGDIGYSQLMNCIIFKASNSSYISSLPSTTIVLNSVSVDYNFFQNSQLNTGCKQATRAEVFKDGNIWNGLTDEAKTKYLGNDGTQVGVWGGMMPWNTTPSYPRITKMNVANRTTADGKLSVEIEVSAAQ